MNYFGDATMIVSVTKEKKKKFFSHKNRRILAPENYLILVLFFFILYPDFSYNFTRKEKRKEKKGHINKKHTPKI